MGYAIALDFSATVQGPDLPAVNDHLYSEDIHLPASVDSEISMYVRFFGAPTFEADASETASGGDLKLTGKVGPLPLSFSFPYTLPAPVQGFVSKATAAGYRVDLRATASVSEVSE